MVYYGAHAWMQPSPFTGHCKCSNNFFFRAVRNTVKYDYIIKCAFFLFIPVFCVKQGLNYLNSAWPHAGINNALEKCQQFFVFFLKTTFQSVYHSSNATRLQGFSFCAFNWFFFSSEDATIVMLAKKWTFSVKKNIKEWVCLLHSN